MVLAQDTLSGRDDHFCQIIFKSHEFLEWVGYDFGMPKLSVSPVTLTFDLVTWFLHATHHLVTMIISAKYFLNPTMHDGVMGRS